MFTWVVPYSSDDVSATNKHLHRYYIIPTKNQLDLPGGVFAQLGIANVHLMSFQIFSSLTVSNHFNMPNSITLSESKMPMWGEHNAFGCLVLTSQTRRSSLGVFPYYCCIHYSVGGPVRGPAHSPSAAAAKLLNWRYQYNASLVPIIVWGLRSY